MPEKIPGAKEDKGKLQMSIVPPEIITAIAEVRRYGLTKYADPENWQRLDPSMLHEALLRHCVALWTDWTAVDPESGLPHLWHLATNAAFLCWFLKEQKCDADAAASAGVEAFRKAWQELAGTSNGHVTAQILRNAPTGD